MLIRRIILTTLAVLFLCLMASAQAEPGAVLELKNGKTFMVESLKYSGDNVVFTLNGVGMKVPLDEVRFFQTSFNLEADISVERIAAAREADALTTRPQQVIVIEDEGGKVDETEGWERRYYQLLEENRKLKAEVRELYAERANDREDNVRISRLDDYKRRGVVNEYGYRSSRSYSSSRRSGGGM
ncbi:MAG: hypothetical protein ACOC54_06380, partial [Candidatus Sumerlaeota bacterium]